MKKPILYFLLIIFIILIIKIFFLEFFRNKLTFDINWNDKYSSNIIHNEPYEEIFKNIYNSSEQQKFISKTILLKTLKFMIEETEEDNPELVDFVKSIIVKPSKNKLNLVNKKKKDFSQIGQSGYIDDLLNSKRNGFFIETGCYDGETFSNSLFFELNRNWTGLLIEAVPNLFQSLINKNRNVYSLNACVGSNRASINKFKVFDALSGRENEMLESHKLRMINEAKSGNSKIETIYVPCFPLHTILKAINVNHVDYFSLDVEGAEYEILKSINFDKISIDALSVEYNGNKKLGDLITNHLKKNFYNISKMDGQDIYFLKTNKDKINTG